MQKSLRKTRVYLILGYIAITGTLIVTDIHVHSFWFRSLMFLMACWVAMMLAHVFGEADRNGFDPSVFSAEEPEPSNGIGDTIGFWG